MHAVDLVGDEKTRCQTMHCAGQGEIQVMLCWPLADAQRCPKPCGGYCNPVWMCIKEIDFSSL